MADEKKVNEAVDAVEYMCRPKLMSKAEAVDFLENVIAYLESSVEALNEEIANAEKDDG